MAVHQGETKRLFRKVKRRPGQIRRNQQTSGDVRKGDRDEHGQQRHEGKRIGQKRMFRTGVRLRVEPDGRRCEVRIVGGGKDDEHRRVFDADRDCVLLSQQKQRNRETSADEQEVDNRVKEDAPEREWTKSGGRTGRHPGQAQISTPVLCPNESVSTPIDCSSVTNRLHSGAFPAPLCTTCCP